MVQRLSKQNAEVGNQFFTGVRMWPHEVGFRLAITTNNNSDIRHASVLAWHWSDWCLTYDTRTSLSSVSVSFSVHVVIKQRQHTIVHSQLTTLFRSGWSAGSRHLLLGPLIAIMEDCDNTLLLSVKELVSSGLSAECIFIFNHEDNSIDCGTAKNPHCLNAAKVSFLSW